MNLIVILCFLLLSPLLVLSQESSSQPLPLCGAPSSIQLTWSDQNGNPLPLGTSQSALLNANLNISSLLQPNSIINLTLNSIPLSSIADLGLLLLIIADETNYNVSTYNGQTFSIDVLEAAYQIFQPGISTPLNESYGFNQTLFSIMENNVQFFTNAANESEEYLGTISIQSNSNTTGIDCETTLFYLALFNPPISAGIRGDPRIVGLGGQEFQVHGIDKMVYNIWSNPDVNVNTRFVFLTEHSPNELLYCTEKYKASEFCRFHLGSYLGELGMITSHGDKLFVQAGSMMNGFEKVYLNDVFINVTHSIESNQLIKQLEKSEKHQNNSKHIHTFSTLRTGLSLQYHNIILQRPDQDTLIITVQGEFTMKIVNADYFFNVVRFVSHTTKANGIIGGTHPKRYYYNPKIIEGEVDDYAVLDGIFGSNFVFNILESKN